MVEVAVAEVAVVEMQGSGERGEVPPLGPGRAKDPPKGRRDGDALVLPRSKGDGEVEQGGCD